jgi:hypothetical protein
MGPTTEMGAALAESLPGDVHVTYVNEAGVSEDVMENLRNNQDIANAVEAWSKQLAVEIQASTVPTLSAFNRGRATKAGSTFAQMSMCAWAVENDDVLSTTADVVEGLMFQKMRFELFDEEQQDVWNQWAAEVDLDSFVRKAARELFKVSQVYVGMWWARKTYTVREDKIEETVTELMDEQREKKIKEAERMAAQQGITLPTPLTEEKKGPGRGNYKRSKTFSVRVPESLTIFDPTKIVPIGNLMFGRQRYAYIAGEGEDKAFTDIFKGEVVDPQVLQLIERKYVPSEGEKAEFADLGVDSNRLWLMPKDAVFRHTLTKADYERFAPLRLRSALPIIEMKGHLRNADRSSLVGNTNFIVLVTKGSDKMPAKPGEIENLQEQVKVIARMPVLVGDHRLHVEIISPALDNTLMSGRWEVLDARLVFKALQTFQPTIQGGNSGSGIKEMARVVARGLEDRRHMLVRSMERHIFKEICDANEDDLDEFPGLTFSPKRIALDYSADVINGILKLRDRGDISRETTLEELDYDQDVEVLRRARERVVYDPVFESSTPFSSPLANPYGVGGNNGAPPPPGQPGGPATPPQNIPGGQQPAATKPGSNVGPNGQPRTEGGRPPGVTETKPRGTAK